MYKKTLSLVLLGLLLNLAFYTTAHAGGEAEKKAKFAAKVKAAVSKLGTGRESRVQVKLRDKTKIKGYVGETGEDGFTLVKDETGEAVEIPYSQVKQVKGKNNLTGEQIGLGVVLVLVLIILATTVQ